MANQPPQQPAPKNPAPAGQPQPQPPGANVVTGPGSRQQPPPGGAKPSESSEGAAPAARPPMSGEGASGQRLPYPGEGPAKQTKPGEADSNQAAVVSRTEKGDQSAGKGNLKIRLEQEDGKIIDHVVKTEDAANQYPFRIRVAGVIYERKRVDDEGREVYGTDPT